MKLLLSGLLFAASLAAADPVFVQAVEFPYHSFPPQLQERELVWMKNIGIDAITIPVARGWTVADTAPLIKIIRRLGMKIYLQPQMGGPAAAELTSLLATQLLEHGGPVVLGMPQPVARVSLKSPNALQLSRSVILSSRGSLVWLDVEDTRDRAGFHRGAVSFIGDEQESMTAVLRRNANLLQYWGAVLPHMHAQKMNSTSRSKNLYPIEVAELTAPDGAAALNLINSSEKDWTGQVGAYFSPAKQHIEIPNVTVNKGGALFLPINIPLSETAFCHNCQTLSKNDRIIYATAELTTVEYENGILAMEFSAPSGGEVLLQLTTEPSGPFLAGGKPTKFTWDGANMRVRLTIPPGQGPVYRTRIGLALQAPDESAFFVDSHPMVIGQANTIATSYSSPLIAQRSRLILPPNLKATRIEPAPDDSPLNINYRIDVPADAVHGDHVQLALEADGVQMGHVRLQLLRPASLRFQQAVRLHYGNDRELISDPPLIPVDAPAGRNIDVTIHNNSHEIRSFTLEAGCDGVQFSPAKADVSIGGSMEREVSFRVFPGNAAPGLHTCSFKVRGAATLDTAASAVVIPRNQSVSYAYDLDADGQTEYVIEDQRVRAVFTRADGGRWLELVWKDADRNVLPENGVEVGKAAIGLKGSDLTIEGATAIENLRPGRFGEATLAIEHPKPGVTTFSLRPAGGS